MIMVDDSTLELIHGEVDGRLSAEQRAELSRRLLADQEARGVHREMSDLRDLLAVVPPAEVPPGLAPAILAALPPAASAGASAERHSGGRAWAYFSAMAAAVALVAIALHLGSNGEGLDTSATVGTMAASPVVEVIAIDDPAIRGTITPRLAAHALVLDFDVSVDEDVAIVALGRGLPLARVERSSQDARSQHFSLELPRLVPGSGPIVLRIMAGDRLVDELPLATPGG